MLRRVAANKNALGERRGMLSCIWIYEFTIMRMGRRYPTGALLNAGDQAGWWSISRHQSPPHVLPKQ